MGHPLYIFFRRSEKLTLVLKMFDRLPMVVRMVSFSRARCSATVKWYYRIFEKKRDVDKNGTRDPTVDSLCSKL